jgi:hypothetical protein
MSINIRRITGSVPDRQCGVQADNEIPAESVLLELEVVVVLEPGPPVVVEVDEPWVLEVPLSVETQPAAGSPAACATDAATALVNMASDFCCRSVDSFCMQPANASVPGVKPKLEHCAVSAWRSGSGVAHAPSAAVAVSSIRYVACRMRVMISP